MFGINKAWLAKPKLWLNIYFHVFNVYYVPQTDVAEICGSPVALAQQLTALELERMSYIGPEEFILAYMRESAHPLHQGKQTNNLESYVAWSSRLSQLVASEICKVGDYMVN